MRTRADVRRQRAWARVAGLLYLVLLAVDMTGMQLSTVLGRVLMTSGTLLTVPLALGLYFAVRPAGPGLAAAALGFRLVEAASGLPAALTGFRVTRAALAGTTLGPMLVKAAQWNDAESFGAFVFTIGSTLFFVLFVRSRYIPRVLAWWGLFASVCALVACATHLVRPSFPAMTMLPWIPALVAETSTGLWLLIRSVRVDAAVAAP